MLVGISVRPCILGVLQPLFPEYYIKTVNINLKDTTLNFINKSKIKQRFLIAIFSIKKWTLMW